jgi:hypothetical protein
MPFATQTKPSWFHLVRGGTEAKSFVDQATLAVPILRILAYCSTFLQQVFGVRIAKIAGKTEFSSVSDGCIACKRSWVQVPIPSITETTISQGIVVFCWYGYQPENQSALESLLDVKRTG